MSLKDIYAVPGKPGLYRLVTRTASRFIVESIDTGKRLPLTLYSMPTDISQTALFTDSDDRPLPEIFQAMLPHEQEIRSLNLKKDAAAIIELFARIVPDYDRSRVTKGDMEKAFRWFKYLRDAGFDDFTSDDPNANPDAQPQPDTSQTNSSDPEE